MSRSYLPAEFRLIYLPYVLERIEDGRYAVLNRRHKPLGVHGMERVDYAPHAVPLEGLTARKAAAISWNGSEDLASVYLYDDGCVPTSSAVHWAAYAQRLALLAKLRVG